MGERSQFVSSLRRMTERELAAAIQAEIEVACAIEDLKVAITGTLVTLTGTAPDETTCEHAAAIAKQCVPELSGVINHLVVRGERT